MGSSCCDDSSRKEIEGDLIDTGERLLALPSSTDELLILLEKVESLLAKVWQRPPGSTSIALLPAVKALMTDEILCHDDVNVQVAVASCFNELARISSPQLPYDDNVIKAFFQLVMIAFRQLSCESSQNYPRALHIIEVMANTRSSKMLLDIGADGLIVKMFQLFFSITKSNHSSDVSGYMEMIMTSVIEESDDISFELLRALLASVKMDKKETSPSSWELGKKVFEICASKVQSCLREAVKQMNLDVADYAEIVASICNETSNMVSKEVTPTIGGGVSQKLNGGSPSETLRGSQLVVQSETNTVPRRSGRCRKPNSVLRPEEGYQYVWTLKVKYSGEASSDGHCKVKNNLSLVSELGKEKKKKSMVNQQNHLDIPSMLERNTRQTKLKERLSDAPKKTGKRAIAESSVIRLEKGKGIHSDTSSDSESDTFFQDQHERKEEEIISRQTEMKEKGFNAPKKTGKRAIADSSDIRLEKGKGNHSDISSDTESDMLPQDQHERKEEEIISRENVHQDVSDMMEELPMSEPANTKHPMEDKEKKPRRSRVDDEEELINSRIHVWWPLDETFYAGTVKAFDPESMKHAILYDDGDVEILNMRKETWEFLANEQPQQVTFFVSFSLSHRTRSGSSISSSTLGQDAGEDHKAESSHI